MRPRVPAGFTVRPADRSDIDAICAIAEAHARELGVPPQAFRGFLEWVFPLAYVDVDRDTALVLQDGIPVAYGQALFDPGEGGPIYAEGSVHPRSWGRGVGSALVDWFGAMVTVRGAERARVGVFTEDRKGHELLRAKGYERTRTAWEMGRSLVGYGEEPPAPEGVTIRSFRPGGDERILHEVTTTAFLDHWDSRPKPFATFATEIFDAEGWEPGLTFLAESGGEVVGETIVLWAGEIGYVVSVGVLRHARGRGIATALMRRAFTTLAARGCDRVELGVDSESPTGAVGLYEGVGMRVLRETVLYTGAAATPP